MKKRYQVNFCGDGIYQVADMKKNREMCLCNQDDPAMNINLSPKRRAQMICQALNAINKKKER